MDLTFWCVGIFSSNSYKEKVTSGSSRVTGTTVL
jgi:hypothetical protein